MPTLQFTIVKKPTDTTTASFREKGSKFTGYLFPVENKEQFEARLEEIRSKYPDATHHCYAWRFNPTHIEEFAQDDGEPPGTAGLPILNQLKSDEAVNAAVVVVRYYGGTNLGKSGLIQAYGRAARLCLGRATFKTILQVRKLRLSYPYPEQNAVDKMAHDFELKELKSSYLEKVTMTLACPLKHEPALKKRLEQLTHKGVSYELLEKSYV